MTLTTALSPEHYEELIISSAIDPQVASARGYRTLTGTEDERQELEDMGFKRTLWARDDAYPMLLIPMHGMDGSVRSHQVKPAVPRTRLKEDGTPVPIKYEAVPKTAPVVDVPAATRERVTEVTDKIPSNWFTEGMKKTDCLVSHGVAAFGLTGVWNWRKASGALGDFDDLPIKGRPAVVCFDSDAAGNRHVQMAMGRFGAWLKSRGASRVLYLIVPPEVNGTSVKGVDDWFAAGGTMEDLAAAATEKAPGASEKDASFTDAFLVEELADALEGRFCWASGLGWLRWTGRVWKEVSDVEPLEAVRRWTSDQYEKACDEQKRNPTQALAPKVAGWRTILNKSRLVALRDLAKGTRAIQRDATEFDGDPDLLTVLNGTLHLPSGALLDFDPAHCITKSCDAEYRDGFTHPAWTAALRAIPSELHEWYQDRLGQALTGYPTPDHTLVIGCGTGSNGKSTVANTIRRTMGGYGVLVSDRVLMASADAHPTELMDFRGARYAIMEETPEARHLNVQRLKNSVGTPSIKARHIRQDTVEFLTSHSLFINTNYKPVVTETDWGTWRRLALLTFPFTFRKPGQSLESAWDRAGDPSLEYAANDPEVRAAALAWMAEGSRQWYARGRMMLPHPGMVERHTREWRAETDLILGFSDECLRFDPDAFTQTRDMLTAFNEWISERGHRPWNDRTFATRFGDHDTVRAAKVKQGRFSIKGKQMRGWSGVEISKDGRNPFTGELEEPPTPFDTTPRPMDLSGVPEEVQEQAGVEEYRAVQREQDAPPAPDDRREGCAPMTIRSPDAKAVMPYPPEPVVLGKVQGTDPVKARFITPEETAAAELTRLWQEMDSASVHQPVVLGFDLETASADQLFTGGYEGPFVRLTGCVGDWSDAGGTVGPNVDAFLEPLNAADAIYAHAGLSYDNIALARHCGADYDALSAKTWDTLVAEVLVDPPLSKGMPNGYYKLNSLAERYGVAGKTDDINALAKKHGGHDKIPLDDPDYNDYLRGDLACLKGVYEAQMARVKELGLEEYAAREMRVLALLNRMTLNGWAVDAGLLAERVAEEEAKRQEAITILNRDYGVPLAAPDRFKLLPKAEWPEEMRTMAVTDARVVLAEQPEKAVSFGLAVRIPGEVHKSPWATKDGKEALVKAFSDAGAPHVPRSVKTDDILTSADALGEGEWWDKNRGRMVKGMLHPDCYGSNDAVRALCEVLALATGARSKYAEIARYVTAQGRVHSEIGAAQGSGRRATNHPSNTNMGIRGAAGEERAVLVADPGHVLLTCDLSQVDMRAVAALSQDPEYMKLFAPGRDAHTEMAIVYFGDGGKESRQKTKAINHKFNYGGGVKSTAEMNGLDIAVVQRADDARREAYPRVIEWLDEVRDIAASGQLLDNGFGRLMRPDPQRAHTQGPALMGQGAARDIMCESLLRLVELAPHVTPYLRGVVHDEVILSVPEKEVGLWARVLEQAFTWEWRGVPILCEVGAPAFRWSECK